MKTSKKKKLEAAGWAVGGIKEFLNLTPEEVLYVELKVALAASLREWRTKQQLTQTELATKLKSSQSRIAKIEAADPTVSVDLMIRALFKLGAKPRDIAKAIV